MKKLNIIFFLTKKILYLKIENPLFFIENL